MFSISSCSMTMMKMVMIIKIMLTMRVMKIMMVASRHTTKTTTRSKPNTEAKASRNYRVLLDYAVSDRVRLCVIFFIIFFYIFSSCNEVHDEAGHPGSVKFWADQCSGSKFFSISSWSMNMMKMMPMVMFTTGLKATVGTAIRCI